MDEGDGGSALNLPSRAPELTATVHDGLDADQHCLRRSEPMHAQGRRWDSVPRGGGLSRPILGALRAAGDGGRGLSIALGVQQR